MVARDAELLRRVLDSRLLDVHTSMPCKVTAFDASEQTVDVQPMIKGVIADPDGTELVDSYPEIYSVPIIYPRSGAFMVMFPLEVDDIVTVVFNEWSIDHFMEKGLEDHPIDLQRHAFSGAVAYPGGPFPSDSPIGETIDGLVIGHDGGSVLRIKDDATVQIGASGAAMQAIALADDVKTELDAIKTDQDTLKTALVSHVHPVPIVGSTGPSPAFATYVPHTPSTVGSSIAEVEE